jgi:predicted RNA-binding Zn ribbon-like protein
VIDFINTVNGRPDFTRDDLIDSHDIIDWARAAGLLTQTGRVKTGSEPLEAAVSLRENLYEVFGPIAAGQTPGPSAVKLVVRRAAQAMRAARWEAGPSGFKPLWPQDSIESICDRLADEAVTLLRSPAVARLGSCAGCGWLFLDTSRGHARRWCSMNVCGVRDKMRRYHQRQSAGPVTM